MMATPQIGEVPLTLFERHVKQALKWHNDPPRLGAESPLASPYFLGRALRDAARPVTARARGEVLRTEIRRTAAQLWRGPPPASHDDMLAAIMDVRRDPEDPRYAYVVLELRCFHEQIEPYRTSDIWEQPHLLPGSKSQHYRDFDAAVKRLAPLLLDALHPALRAERPQAPSPLYGYDEQLARVTQALAQGRTVALSGPGGVGKTSIGATAVDQLNDHPMFWYTLRPGFNDSANSLLFALGAFLHEQGAPNLWQYLVTANGVIGDLNLAAGLLRQDLALLAGRPPILCFDDLEHLATRQLTVLAPGHAQLLDLIDGLRGTVPLLLISQRAQVASDLHLELAGLGITEVGQLWRAAGHSLTPEQATQLHTYAGGNLTLLLALQESEDDPMPQLSEREVAPSLLPAFQRLWRRLTPDERRALQRLSIYQGYAPEDVVAPAMIATLARLRLIERDGEGGIAVLPALAPIVRDDLSPELSERLHGEAAVVRLERGEYTAAAYHFSRSGQEKQAVQLWLPHRQRAIAGGEADAAWLIFSQISPQRLDPAERTALAIIRAELLKLTGQHEAGLRELESVDWAAESEASAHLWMLRGEMEHALGYPERALESYGEGLRVTARLTSRLTALHQHRGTLLLHRRDLEASWAEIRRAEFDLEVLRGLLWDEEGTYDQALAAHRRARELAEQIDDDALRGLAERQIARVYGRRQQLEEAVLHAAQAIAIYERMGDRVNLEKMRSNLAFIYV
ncbi:MAG: ATP-binding protein, partial [Chloroflexales bacterium]|nr:ATP-binding protein [Chloroflexales bacterium]